MSAFAIRLLRHRLDIQAPVRTPDGGGGATETWSSTATVWAAIRPTGAGEPIVADAHRGEVSHEIWIRFRNDVLPGMRFAQGSRVFEIVGVIDVGERHRR
ncbi:MAG TPA: phage head closure protein, partial [Hyphomicrobiaceae bacterium]|nr:phage head closure protein [Hyphomicrobiaceae bacterium]